MTESPLETDPTDPASPPDPMESPDETTADPDEDDTVESPMPPRTE